MITYAGQVEEGRSRAGIYLGPVQLALVIAGPMGLACAIFVALLVYWQRRKQQDQHRYRRQEVAHLIDDPSLSTSGHTLRDLMEDFSHSGSGSGTVW